MQVLTESKVSELLKLELQVIVSYLIGAGIELRSSIRVVLALNCRANPSAQETTM